MLRRSCRHASPCPDTSTPSTEVHRHASSSPKSTPPRPTTTSTPGARYTPLAQTERYVRYVFLGAWNEFSVDRNVWSLILYLLLVGVRSTNPHRRCQSASFYGPSQETGCFKFSIDFLQKISEGCTFRVLKKRTFDPIFWKNFHIQPWHNKMHLCLFRRFSRETVVRCFLILIYASNSDLSVMFVCLFN